MPDCALVDLLGHPQHVKLGHGHILRHGGGPASGTPRSEENTHPFEQRGRALGHNGVVGGMERLERELGAALGLVHGDAPAKLGPPGSAHGYSASSRGTVAANMATSAHSAGAEPKSCSRRRSVRSASASLRVIHQGL